MSNKKDLTKDKRIEKEIKKLRNIYKDIDEDQFITVEELINRASYLLVLLQEYEKDIDENGYVELFSQSKNQEPYERERPVVRLYNTTIKNYQSIIRQLSKLLPNDVKTTDDGFDSFINKDLEWIQ